MRRIMILLAVAALSSCGGSSGTGEGATANPPLDDSSPTETSATNPVESPSAPPTSEAPATTEATTTTLVGECNLENKVRFRDDIRQKCVDGRWEEFPVQTTPPLPPTTTTTTLPAVPWSPDEMQTALTEPLLTWIQAPSEESYALVASAARDFVNTPGRQVDQSLLSPNANPDFLTAEQALIAFYEAPGFGGGDPVPRTRANFVDVMTLANHLNLPQVWGAQQTQFGSGTYRVGSGPSDVPPGSYVAESDTPFDGCYWETLDPNGDIIDNNFVGSGFRVVANVSSRAFSVEFDDCGVFIRQ